MSTIKYKIITLILFFIAGNLNAQSGEFTTVQFSVENVTASATSHPSTSPLYTIDGKGAYDGDNISRWSTYPTPAWITYDLGKSKTISKTEFSFYFFEKGRVYTYSIFISEDNSNWTAVIDHAQSGSNEYTVNSFSPINGRYIKLVLHSANNSKWATVWEARIFGIEDLIPPKLKNVDVLSASSLLLTFSEDLAANSVANNNNYSINGGISVYSASLVDQNKIVLNTSIHNTGNFTVTVENIFDLYGNVIGAENKFDYSYYDNTPVTPEPEQPVVIEKLSIADVTASATSNTLTSPLYTIDGKGAYDGDVNSRWSTYPTPAWITYDLGENKSVCKTAFSFYYFDKKRTYEYSVFISEDNSNWKTVVDKALSGENEYTINEFEAVTGRFVKLELHKANNTKWATVWETQIYGSENITNEPVTPVTKKVDLNVTEGWNIVSVPVDPLDRETNLLFQNQNISQAFNYDEDYIEHQTIKSGVGYWVRFKDKASFEVEGYSNKESIELRHGWNMIGSIDNINISDLYTEPADIIESLFYGFNGNYTIEDSLIIGKGYWVKAAEAGILYFDKKGQNKNLSKSTLVNNQEVYHLTITDSKHNSMTLFLSDNNSTLSKISLPPVPPEGAFDVRFSNGQILNSLAKLNTSLMIRDAVYPINISTDAENLVISFVEAGTNKNINLKKDEVCRINSSSAEIINIEYKEIPNEFKLVQNYPNPFNPVTTIEFSIPVQSKAKLEIFNILGETIQTLVNDELEAGFHKINFNAQNLASGIYLYRLTTTEYSSIKKMTLLK